MALIMILIVANNFIHVYFLIDDAMQRRCFITVRMMPFSCTSLWRENKYGLQVGVVTIINYINLLAVILITKAYVFLRLRKRNHYEHKLFIAAETEFK
jgi:hypothetical protein